MVTYVDVGEPQPSSERRQRRRRRRVSCGTGICQLVIWRGGEWSHVTCEALAEAAGDGQAVSGKRRIGDKRSQETNRRRCGTHTSFHGMNGVFLDIEQVHHEVRNIDVICSDFAITMGIGGQ